MALLQQVQTRNKQETYCQKVLGSQEQVDRCADMWKMYGEVFQAVADHALIEFCEEEEFNKAEYNFFKGGVSYLGAFLARCKAESEEKKKTPNNPLQS